MRKPEEPDILENRIGIFVEKVLPPKVTFISGIVAAILATSVGSFTNHWATPMSPAGLGLMYFTLLLSVPMIIWVLAFITFFCIVAVKGVIYLIKPNLSG